MTKRKYFDDLTLEEMFKSHDWTYMYADDNRYYTSGRRQKELIDNKIEQSGGWSQDILKLHNAHCPKPMQISEEWLENHLLKQ
jgi:hypothetical protein